MTKSDPKEKIYDDHIAWLEATIESLREDNETLSAELLRHKETLDTIIPLRRHAKRQVKYHLRRVDRLISKKLARTGKFKPLDYNLLTQNADGPAMISTARRYDQENFTAYVKSATPQMLLPVYLSSKRTVLKSARSLKNRL